MRDSLIFYRSFYESIKELPLEAQTQVYNAIFEYSLNLEEVELSGIAKAVFTLIKPQLDANIKRYENGKKGGRKKVEKETKQEPNPNQKETKTKANYNDNVNDNVNINFEKLVDFVNQTFGRQFRFINAQTKQKFRARLKEGYTPDDIFNAIINTKKNKYHIDTNFQYCTPEFFSRASTLDKYSQIKRQSKKINL